MVILVFIWILLDLYKVLDSILFRFSFCKAKMVPGNYPKLIQVFISLLRISFSRHSCPEVFCEKGVLENSTKFTGKLFFNKVAGLGRGL